MVEVFDNLMVVGRKGCMRTPVAAAMLQRGLYECEVHSAAVEPGEGFDVRAERMAAAWELNLGKYKPKPVTRVLIENVDIILALDTSVWADMFKRGYDNKMLNLKLFLFGKWCGDRDIPELGPRDQSSEFDHETAVLEQMNVFAESWTHKLQGRKFSFEH